MKREKLRTVGVSKHSDGSGNYDTIAYFHKWTEISIVDKTDEIAENAEMLHDELYSKYWDWKKIRPNKSWKLDNYEE